MAQSDHEIKKNKPRAISRDFVPRTLEDETPVTQKNPEARPEATQEVKVHRREMMRTLIPASGKALAGFLRNLRTEVASHIDEIREKKSDKSK